MFSHRTLERVSAAKSTKKRFFWIFLGSVVLVLVWQLAAWTSHPTVIASPSETFAAMLRFLTDSSFYSDHLFPSLARIVGSILIGGMAGCFLGALAGFRAEIKWALEPARFVLMSLPAVIVAILAMLWFGLGSTMVMFTTALLVSPFLYLGTVNGIEAIDTRLIDMATVYQFPKSRLFLYVVLPAVVPSVLSSLSVTVANGLRLSVLAEVLGVNDGIGFLIAASRSNLLTDDLFALVGILFLLVVLLDTAVTTPIRKLARRMGK